MSVGTCSQCGTTAALSSLRQLNGQTYCEPCLGKATREALEAGQPLKYGSACARCGGQSADGRELTLVGKHLFCSSCRELITQWPYPRWLKLALACLLVLLGVALVHGRKYFHAGRVMYVGERLVEKGRYAEALPYLQETLRIAPRSDKAVLLAAKAALLSGDVDSAGKALQGHDDGYFENGDKTEFKEVSALWDRATQAVKKADEASQLEQQDGKAEEAARLMHEAASTYPEMHQFAFATEYFDAGAAFERKDYDTFLTIAEKQFKEQAGSSTAGGLASALACKYAVTGDVTYQQRSLEMLDKSRQMAQGDPEAIKSLDEYSERILYRIKSRQIISKTEYDRRFRGGKTAAR